MKCVHCGEEFVKRVYNQIYCSKRCRDRAKYLRNTEYRLAYTRQYYADHRDELSEKKRHYYAANRDEIKAKTHEYYVANREEILAWQRKQRSFDKDVTT